MKRIWFSLLLVLLAIGANAQHDNKATVLDTVYTVHSINQERFKELIADYTAHEWVMRSPRPVVVDFYADWCGPCRRLAPILRDIAQHYQGEVDFYRINVDDNQDIASVFEVRSIPMLLICPLEGEPKTVVGLYPMEEYIRVFNQALGR
jgi:thioredoxin